MDNYQSLAADSRVWIYQSSRPFTEEVVEKLRTQVKQFATQWVSHNQQLKAFGDVLYNRFIVLIVDETMAGASGCSIDSSVKFVKNIEQDYHTDLFDRMAFAFQQDGEIRIVSKDEFARLFAAGKINDDTLVFDHLVNSKSKFEKQWLVPLKKSWHKKMV